MPSQTVEYGIDLGTTNSAIARAASTGVKIIKNRMQSDITPSAVARTRAGQTLVGQSALDKPDLAPATRFKRLMGTTNATTLADGSIWLPEELSAEVLKDLKASVQRRFDVIPTHVVVTVPAMFQQPQCEATNRAAELAGLTAVSLLQEPIAAATAYLNDEAQEGYYMVYDLGGGTFDVSVVRILDNAMSVVAHGGDNYLGGSDFDRIIAEWVIGQIERRHGKLPELREVVRQYQLLQICEQAKKMLSDEAETIIDLSDMELPMSQLSLSREVFETMIAEPISRTIRLSRDRLTHAELSSRDVRSVLLVGGPTMTPYVRRAIREELGIPVSVDQDPMTVVAVGASIAASSILIPTDVTFSPQLSQDVVIELYYDPVSPDTTCTVSGKVSQPRSFTGEVRLTRSDGAWDSGWLPLRSSAFQCELALKPRSASEFQISVRDLQGTVLSVSPSSLSLRHGLAVATPVTPYKYGVALVGNLFHGIVQENEPLPTVGTTTDFRASKTVAAGSDESLLIYFLEGSSRIARDNAKVGTLAIRGQDLTRTLKEGEKIEIRIKMDESRRIEARVFVPLHDLDYKVPLESRIDKTNEEDLWQSLTESAREVQDLKFSITPDDEQKLQQCEYDLDRIEAEMQQVHQGDAGAGERVMQQLMPVKAHLRDLNVTYASDVAWRKANDMIDAAEQICVRLNVRMGVSQAHDLRIEAERSKKLDDINGLKAIYAKANNLYWEHYRETPECWIEFVEWLQGNRRFATDILSFDEYMKRAGECLQQKDYEGTRLNGLRAMSFLPEDKAESGRFSDAGLTR